MADLNLAVRSFRENKVAKDRDNHALSQADQQRAAGEVEAAAPKVSAAWDSTDAKSALGALSNGVSPGADSILGALPIVWKVVADVRPHLGAAKKKLGM